MVRLDKKPGDYTLRVADRGLTQIISGYATIRYKGGDKHLVSKPYLDYNGQNLTVDMTILDKSKIPPWPPVVPAQTSDAMHLLRTDRFGEIWRFTLNGVAMYPPDWNAYTPSLYDPNLPDTLNNSLVIRTLNGTWQDFVIQISSFDHWAIDFPHMIHKHSTKTWQIGTNYGTWNYSSVAEAIADQPGSFNLVNPPYRDTFNTDFSGPMWIVLRYQVTNPGPWLFHCHIETHLAAGMAIAILDGVDKWPSIPREYGVDAMGQISGHHG
jgi:hypothetical protein